MHLIVSYTRSDQEAVKPLVEGLRRTGHDVWLDRELTGGESWWASILSHIRASDALILAVSMKELESDACQREVDYARALGKPVLPVMVSPVTVAQLPSDLASEQFVDFTHPSFETAFMLAGAISKLPTAPPLPDPLPEPPAVPISYLNEIAGRIYGGKVLTLDDQFAIIGRLRQGLQVDADRETATRLLQRLKSRPDTLYAAAREIDATLGEGVKPPTAETPGTQVPAAPAMGTRSFQGAGAPPPVPHPTPQVMGAPPSVTWHAPEVRPPRDAWSAASAAPAPAVHTQPAGPRPSAQRQAPPPAAARPGMVPGIVGFSVSILSLLLFVVPFLNFLVAATGLVIGIISRRHGSTGWGLAAVIIGITGVTAGIAWSIYWIIGQSSGG